MYLYKITSDDNLINIREKQFKKEIVLQRMCEKNLEEIFNLKFVKSEFSIGSFRIDTLAYDSQKNSFVIIEYKNNKNFSVIDQGYSYLSLMLNNKADFILEYNENCLDSLKRNDIDWSQSRIIFISPSFTKYQKESINFKDLPIELWQVKKFENNLVQFNPIKSVRATESIKTISNTNNEISKVNKEIKVYTEEDNLNKGSEETIELYKKFKYSILNLCHGISINPTKLYIGFVVNKRDIADITLFKKSLKIWINLKIGELDDPKDIARDVTGIGHWGNGDYEIKVSDDNDLEYILSLIKQSIRKHDA